MFRLLVTVLLVHASNAWVLETSHQKLYANMVTDVTLHCHYDNRVNGQSRLHEVLRISIDKVQAVGPLITIASAYFAHGESEITIFPNASSDINVKGHAENVGSSFLTVTWHDAFPKALGKYLCTINGIAADYTSVHINSNAVTLVETQCEASHLLPKALAIEQESEESGNKIRDVLTKMQNNTNDTFIQIIAQRLDVIRNNAKVILSDYIKELDQECQRGPVKVHTTSTTETTPPANITGDTLQWPEGVYSLPNTIHGCPTTQSIKWTENNKIFYTDHSYPSRNKIATPNHFAQPVFTAKASKHMFNYRTCQRQSDSHTQAWPKGSYCVGKLNAMSCPPAFQKGFVRLTAEKDFTYFPTYMHTCCRKDGTHDNPIGLPVSKPFYLFRYGDRCQQVHNADATQEWVTVDTEHINNMDGENGTHSDATINPYHFYACYYQQQQ